MRQKSPVVFALLVVMLILPGVLTACGSTTPAPPPIIGQNCGTVARYQGALAQGSVQGTDCLWQAYQQCHAATLVYASSGVDTGGENAITVQPKQGTCAVTDAVQFYSDNFPGGSTSPVTTYPCGGLLRQFGGLVAYACGQSDNIVILHVTATVLAPGVPANLPDAIPTDCGIIRQFSATTVNRATNYYTPTPNSSTSVTGCLSTAWATQCVSTRLTYDSYSATRMVRHIFTLVATNATPCKRILVDAVQSQGMTLPASDIHIYTCAGVTTTAQGIAVRDCGADGTVAIPNVTASPATGFTTPPRIGKNCNGSYTFAMYYRPCFLQAYQQCQAASMPINYPGDLVLITDTLTVQPRNGGCVLTDAVQLIIGPGQPAAMYQTFTCGALRQQDNEIQLIGCGALGERDIPWSSPD